MLQVHPAADLFPTMSGAELVELGEDIKRRTLQQPVTLLMPKDGGEPVLLDGRNRLAAMGAVGMLVIGAGRKLAVRHEIIDETADFDPVAFVISANIHRGHLTA
ncbi:MAG: hypothetical protein JO008_12205 [Alphaproteobacteria bacterium]|nr:hypothetical protein [Alphaproteobacteria bacterium]